MGEDEVGTVRILTSHRAAMRDVITHFRGRVVDSPGDNLLAEFASVADAVQCAVEIQRSLGERNARLPEGRRLEFRIGVNLGDVLVDDERIYGDAINVAARLQSLAEAGGISISGTAYDQVENRLPYRYESLGEHTVKNIAKPVRVYRVVVEELATTPQSAETSPMARVVPVKGRYEARQASARAAPGSRPGPRAHRPSIAVLPFREDDVRAGDSYFADGIVEDIVGALVSLPDLFVISRSSTLGFRGASADVRSVGRKLDVQYVLSGSVRRMAQRIRTGAELSDTETGAVLWTDSVEGTVDDVFALQDRLSSPPTSAKRSWTASCASAPTAWTLTTSCSAASISCTGYGETSSNARARCFSARLTSSPPTRPHMPSARNGTASGSARGGRKTAHGITMRSPAWPPRPLSAIPSTHARWRSAAMCGRFSPAITKGHLPSSIAPSPRARTHPRRGSGAAQPTAT